MWYNILFFTQLLFLWKLSQLPIPGHWSSEPCLPLWTQEKLSVQPRLRPSLGIDLLSLSLALVAFPPHYSCPRLTGAFQRFSFLISDRHPCALRASRTLFSVQKSLQTHFCWKLPRGGFCEFCAVQIPPLPVNRTTPTEPCPNFNFPVRSLKGIFPAPFFAWRKLQLCASHLCVSARTDGPFHFPSRPCRRARNRALGAP